MRPQNLNFILSSIAILKGVGPKLEKIINSELHLDSEEEKAAKLQKMIDDLQDKRIKENQEAINKLKKRG